MGIDTNTVCRWVRDYRRKNGLPSYKEEKGISDARPVSDRDLLRRNKENFFTTENVCIKHWGI